MSSKPIEIHFDKRLNNLNLVQEADVGQRREFLIVAGLAILMALGIIAYGWQHYKNLDFGYHIEEAGKQQAQLIKEREKLRIEHQFLRSSERIDRIARKMGMVVAAPGQVQLAPAEALSSSEPELAARQ
jgi:cell division protein FtsL